MIFTGMGSLWYSFSPGTNLSCQMICFSWSLTVFFFIQLRYSTSIWQMLWNFDPSYSWKLILIMFDRGFAAAIMAVNCVWLDNVCSFHVDTDECEVRESVQTTYRLWNGMGWIMKDNIFFYFHSHPFNVVLLIHIFYLPLLICIPHTCRTLIWPAMCLQTT